MLLGIHGRAVRPTLMPTFVCFESSWSDCFFVGQMHGRLKIITALNQNACSIPRHAINVAPANRLPF
jgi:hypothetical protein